MIDWSHVARELLRGILTLLLAPLWVPVLLGMLMLEPDGPGPF